MAAPAETRTLNLHRAKHHRSSRVRMEAWRQWQLGRRKNLVQRKTKRILLTPTGLLMEAISLKPLLLVRPIDPSLSEPWNDEEEDGCSHYCPQIVALSPLIDPYPHGPEGAHKQKPVNAISFRFSLTFGTKRISPDCDRDCNRQTRCEEIKIPNDQSRKPRLWPMAANQNREYICWAPQQREGNDRGSNTWYHSAQKLG